MFPILLALLFIVFGVLAFLQTFKIIPHTGWQISTVFFSVGVIALMGELERIVGKDDDSDDKQP